jgi:hypothetical protein
LELFESSGHFPWLEEPDSFFNKVRIFASEHSARPGSSAGCDGETALEPTNSPMADLRVNFSNDLPHTSPTYPAPTREVHVLVH